MRRMALRARAGQAGAFIRQRREIHRAVISGGLVLILLMGLLLASGGSARANPDAGVPAGADCAQLAHADTTATNGPTWGRTLLAGHNAPGGWFGVDVCSNGYLASAPQSAQVSCDRAPKDASQPYCAPGTATSDGYGWSFQCVELIVRFSAWAFGTSPSAWGRSGWGNAPDLWQPENHPADFVMYPNGSATAPVPGDILVWGNVDAQGRPWPAGPDGAHGGHIAVVASVGHGRLTTAEQNVKWGTEDHPGDTLALTHTGAGWVLSGTTAPATTLPTYRWPGTMGTTRATYGWLHSLKNTGVFPSPRAGAVVRAAPSVSPTPAPGVPPIATAVAPQLSGGLPSLAPATFVTQGGTLADLVWAGSDLIATTDQQTTPQARMRHLGAPADARLALGQTPATLTQPDATRYSYVVGADGHLASARTGPAQLGVTWSDLGAPAGVILDGSAAVTRLVDGVAVIAHGSDGALWWRGGPPDRLGAWLTLGAPQAARLSGSFALVGLPGQGTPLLLALSTDGRLYERVWQSVGTDDLTGVPTQPGWSEWLALSAQPAGLHLTGPLLAVHDVARDPRAINDDSTPLSLYATDTHGAVWQLRTTASDAGWSVTMVEQPVSGSASAPVLLGATALPPSASSGDAATPPATQLYLRARDALQVATISQNTQGDGAAAPTVQRASLPALPADLAQTPPGVAFAVASDASVVVVSGTGGAAILGTDLAFTSLLPDGVSTPPAEGATAYPRLSGSGAVADTTFADSLQQATLDPRWVTLGAGDASSVTATVDGLRLAPVTGATLGLVQLAAAGDATVTVQVSAEQQVSEHEQVGLVFYQDAGDWLTLLLDHTGAVSLCARALQVTSPCMRQRMAIGTTTQPYWLRVIRRGDRFTGQASHDGVLWVTVGQWSPVVGATAASAPTAQATPVVAPGATPWPTPAPNGNGALPIAASRAFAEWGMLARSDGAATSWPLLRDFAVAQAG